MASQKSYYEDYWAGWAKDWARPTHADLITLIKRNIRPDLSVLDVGCGDGRGYQRVAASLAHIYVGVDISETAVSEARRQGLDARLIEDATRLPFDDATFDICFAFEVLEHLWSPHLAVREMRRVLRPGAALVATVPNVVTWRHRIDILLLGRFNPGGHPTRSADEPWHDPHVRFFTRKTLAAMAAAEGLTSIRVGAAGFSLFGQMPFVKRRGVSERWSRPFRPLQHLFPSLLGALLVLEARKPERDSIRTDRATDRKLQG